MKALHLLVLSVTLPIASVHADNFGSGLDAFAINFVTIGNAGNGDDGGAGGGIYSSPYGSVPYVYQMGVTEVARDWITKATNLGMVNVTAGPWSGNQPAANLTWYEAAAFVNWLNTSSGHQPAYQLNGTNTALTPWTSADAWQLGGENLFRHKDAYYFLPSEDEWYKAAYHKNDGVTANYWDYATKSNSAPAGVAGGTQDGTAVYNQLSSQGPAAVDNSGGLSAYGTRGQTGNLLEWMETALDGVNDSSFEERTFRGGHWSGSASVNQSSVGRGNDVPLASFDNVGFRVASIPEPSCAALLLGSGFALLTRRKRVRCV